MRYIGRMKTSALPTVRIEPALRSELESVLRQDESLSSFVESAVRKAVDFRRLEAEFHARGHASWDELQRTGVSHSVQEVLDTLRQHTAARRSALKP